VQERVKAEYDFIRMLRRLTFDCGQDIGAVLAPDGVKR
jgi:hypothetical protein